MSTISTHVLDTSLGMPAAGITVTLRRGSEVLGTGMTDSDGRVKRLLAEGTSVPAGEYSLSFEVADYFAATERPAFFGRIVLDFRIAAADEHYHVPLLLSPFGYSTYRGS